MRKRSKRSVAWNYFAEVGDGRYRCGFCMKLLSYKGGSVFNLTRHLRIFHSAQCDFRAQRKPARIISVSFPVRKVDYWPPRVKNQQKKESTTKMNTIRENQNNKKPLLKIKEVVSRDEFKEIDLHLVKMIVRDYHAISMVDGEAFRKFVKLLNPRYILPSQKEILKELLPRIYAQTKQDVRECLSLAATVTITTNYWISPDRKQFINLIVHYISDKCELNSYFLDCFQITEEQTADNISEEIKKILKEWKVNEKVIAVISENRKNFVDALYVGGWHYVPCTYHLLKNILDSEIRHIQETADKLNVIADLLNSKPDLRHKFKQIQEEKQIEFQKLEKGSTKYWESIRKLFVTSLELKESLKALFEFINEKSQILTTNDWKIVEDANDIFKILHGAITEISNEKNISVAKAIMIICTMNNSLAETINVKPIQKVVQKMATNILNEVKLKFRRIENNIICGETMLLDPRYKKTVFTSLETYNKAFQSLIKKANKLSDKKIAETATGNAEVTKFIQELYQDQDDDPLLWWRDRKLLYPALYKLMLARLCIVATSIPRERVFSKRGYLINKNQGQLKLKQISQILFLNHNL